MKWHHCFRFLPMSVVTEACSQLVILQRKQLKAVTRLAKVFTAFEAKQILRLDHKNENSLHQIYRCRRFFVYIFSFSHSLAVALRIYKLFSIELFLTTDQLTYIFSMQLTNHHVAKKKLHVPQKIVNRKTDNSSCNPKDVDL